MPSSVQKKPLYYRQTHFTATWTKIPRPSSSGLRWEVASHIPWPMTVAVDAIIERLGGADAAAKLTGVGTEAVRKWRQSGGIPSRHWAAVVAATGLAWSDLSGVSTSPDPGAVPAGATAALVVADGAVFWGRGFGAHTP